MKVLCLLFAAMIGLLRFWQSTNRAEDAAARTPLENYIERHATGNGDFMRKPFHTEDRIIGFSRGEMTNLTAEEVCLALDVLFQPNQLTSTR